MSCRLPHLLLASLLGIAATPAHSEEDRVDFLRDVRPVLSGYCFKCHGPDKAKRKGKLRLDIREEALRPGNSGEVAIVPGKPKKSELVYRVFTDDEEDIMPPGSAKQPLSQKQKEILKRWISAGAEYQPHWAFVKPVQPDVPEVNNRDWPRNSIDHFTLSGMESAGLRPSEEAGRFTLVRRVYLDLIGLPPTPGEADAFVNDKSANAYEKLVDRLLASPHYGERWARRWLDLARYADTNGYEKDRRRSIWPYRDWVINAINSGMPFDRFTIEQIAGDMLARKLPKNDPRKLDLQIATGFHRNTMLNEEGGIDPQEYRFYSLVDRVHVTSTAWLGLTMACAQCHTHKYDPIQHEEYYQFLAFMNNADEPWIDVPNPGIAARRAEQEKKIAKLESDLISKFSAEGKLKKWIEVEAPKVVKWEPLKPVAARGSFPTLTIEEDNIIFVSGDFTKSDTYEVEFAGDWNGVRAMRLEALTDDRLPRKGPGRVLYEGPIGDFFMSDIKVNVGEKEIPIKSATDSFHPGRHSAANTIDDDLQSGWMINGGQGRNHNAVFVFERPFRSKDPVRLTMVFEKHYAAGLGKFRVSVTRDEGAAALAYPDDIQKALLAWKNESGEVRRKVLVDQLRRHYVTIAPELKNDLNEIKRLRKSMPKFPTTLVLVERPEGHARTTRVHKRGEFLQPMGEVKPGIPSFLPGLPEGAPRDRLSLARWLVSEENPLTARVVMNRNWQAFFGRGIVKTMEDFGFQGELPTHPKLLDWLAVEFMKRKWSIKAMHKLIVMSATYRQSGLVKKTHLQKDPENVLLARGPRFRLDAEQIRDAALVASGLLSEKLGGPSVFPPQLPNITTEGTYGPLKWSVSKGEDRYRRSLYTFAKRTAPFAMFSTFDGPSGEACLARRDRSNTPLQSLTLLNDEMFLEMARAMGRSAAVGNGSVEKRAVHLFRRCLTRPPEAEELAKIVAFYRKQLGRFESGELRAIDLMGGGKGSELNEQAAWTAVARVLMNLDETVTKS